MFTENLVSRDQEQRLSNHIAIAIPQVFEQGTIQQYRPASAGS
jgi:hypothetical protein